MVIHQDRERIKSLLAETITLLCKNGLNFKTEFCIEALIGITLDRDDVFLVNIKETVRSLEKELEETATSSRDDLSSSDEQIDTKPNIERLKRPSGTSSHHHHHRSNHSSSRKQSQFPGVHTENNENQTSATSLDSAGEGSQRQDDSLGGKNGSTRLWGSVAPNQSSLRNTGGDGGDEEGDAMTPPPKRPHLSSPKQWSQQQHTSISDRDQQPAYSWTSSDPVVIKDEPDSDLENFGDDSLQTPYSAGDTSQADSIAKMHGDAGGGHFMPGDGQEGASVMWQGMGRPSPSAASAAAGSMVAMTTAHRNQHSDDLHSVPRTSINISRTAHLTEQQLLRIGRGILSSKGSFVSLNWIRRSLWSTVECASECFWDALQQLTLDRDHDGYVGECSDCAVLAGTRHEKRLKIFFKCPPQMLNLTALVRMGMPVGQTDYFIRMYAEKFKQYPIYSWKNGEAIILSIEQQHPFKHLL